MIIKVDSYTVPIQSYDGSCNSIYLPWLNMADTPFQRLTKPCYADGYSTFSRTLPKPRYVSNAILNQNDTEDYPDERYLNDLGIYWGQHINHNRQYASVSALCDWLVNCGLYGAI